ncbi:ATP-binding protein [Halioxenophilus sp. WMMB6]|uniref:ATP-binding protein n=1 Tax=Halioxenophilus sp. WMMB6 TaxID=3073815 RepID=UPI00295F329E|nr:ATP-binding protein [Halioxenophilus sp. WMMB6]
MSIEAPKRTPYPLLTMLAAIFLLAYFYAQTHAGLRAFYPLPDWIFLAPVPESLLAGFVVLLLAELRLVERKRKIQKRAIREIRAQMDELLANKRQLNAKAHVYANHADKLKLFISDKLLEYIEYDEKFLHFKSIASEVRHNGVISYDKVSTALEQQIAQLAESNSNDSGDAGSEENSEAKQLREAVASMRYLWDLLDLSTTDNIALHIANKVCEAEELLFQAELNNAQALPEKPIFAAEAALEKALTRCFGSPPIAVPSPHDYHTLQVPEHNLVWVRCHPAAPLLGNENHLILALENIINNAQYFAGRQGNRKLEKNARIAIELYQEREFIGYRVYNRGPHINDESAAKLFQLGYSTRRVKQNNGKGLGLYFVNEIIKGYDGKISHQNIANRPDVLSLRMELNNGTVITDVIEQQVVEGKPCCRKTGSESAVAEMEWDLAGELASIEVTHQSDQKTHRFVGDALAEGLLPDPSQSFHPRWQLQIDAGRFGHTRLRFIPQDIAGVLFELKMPSLNARLEGDLLVTDEEGMDRQVADIASRFKALEE